MEAARLKNRSDNDEGGAEKHASTATPSVHDVTAAQTAEDAAHGVYREDSAVQLARHANLEALLEGLHGVDGAHDGAIEAVHDAVEDAERHHGVELDLTFRFVVGSIFGDGVGERNGLDCHLFDTMAIGKIGFLQIIIKGRGSGLDAIPWTASSCLHDEGWFKVRSRRHRQSKTRSDGISRRIDNSWPKRCQSRGWKRTLHTAYIPDYSQTRVSVPPTSD